MNIQKYRFIFALPILFNAEENLMSSRKWTLKYGATAVIAATMIFAITLIANPLTQNPAIVTSSQFLVMLTDPPNVPEGTTQLNLTYSDISIHVTYPNQTAIWLPIQASGTVNLLSLVNMSQTLASTTVPANSEIDKIQFNIVNVTTAVKGTEYNVTALSSTITMTIENSLVNQSLSGVLIDFNPTLVQIQGTDVKGEAIDYFVLVPSATAHIVDNVQKEQSQIGTVVELDQQQKTQLDAGSNELLHNVIITSASLSVNGNTTNLEVSIKNEGNRAYDINGLILYGEFNSTLASQGVYQTIPLKPNGSALVPFFGVGQHQNDIDQGNVNEADGQNNNVDQGSRNEESELPALTLQPGQEVKLQFSDIVTLRQQENQATRKVTFLPILGNSYTLKIVGEGALTFTLKATL
jgi:hypothetical protein